MSAFSPQLRTIRDTTERKFEVRLKGHSSFSIGEAPTVLGLGALPEEIRGMAEEVKGEVLAEMTYSLSENQLCAAALAAAIKLDLVTISEPLSDDEVAHLASHGLKNF